MTCYGQNDIRRNRQKSRYFPKGSKVFERAVGHNRHVEKYLTEKKDLLLKHFDDMIKKNGQVVVQSEGGFWHCYKA